MPHGASEMMAIILAGGKGTRLKPYTMTIPKPLMPLGDMPILEIIVRQLVRSGVTRIVLTLGHMVPFFTSFIGDGERWGVPIEYTFEEEPLGTAGSLRLVKDLADDFIVMNGDVLTTLSYGELFKSHRDRSAWATLAMNRRELQIDFGVVKADADGALAEYQEKPVIPYNVSMGINVLSKKALEFIPEGRKFDMPDLMLAIKAAGKPAICYGTACYWQDIGRFDDYQKAGRDFVEDPDRFLLMKNDR